MVEDNGDAPLYLLFAVNNVLNAPLHEIVIQRIVRGISYIVRLALCAGGKADACEVIAIGAVDASDARKSLRTELHDGQGCANRRLFNLARQLSVMKPL
jgi:hypothetical protein